MTDANPVAGIRLARSDEAAALSELCFCSKAVWGYDAAFMAQAQDALSVDPAQIAAGDVWVAVAPDGSVAGVVALAPGVDAAAIDLDKLFVAPARIRGGFGRALLGHAVAEARRRGATRLTISGDPFAAAFYRHCGARLIGEAPSDAIPGRMLPLYEIDLNDA